MGNPGDNAEVCEREVNPMDQLRLTWDEMVKAWRDDFFDEDTLQRLAAVGI